MATFNLKKHQNSRNLVDQKAQGSACSVAVKTVEQEAIGNSANYFQSEKMELNMKNLRKQLGQGMTEYIIIVALIAVSAIGVYSMFGKTLRSQMAGLSSELSGTSAKTAIGEAQKDAAVVTKLAAKKTDLGNYDGAANTGAEGK